MDNCEQVCALLRRTPFPPTKKKKTSTNAIILTNKEKEKTIPEPLFLCLTEIHQVVSCLEYLRI